MALNVEATINDQTLGDFLGVTRKELAASMDRETLVAAARDERQKFSRWMTETKWQGLSEGVADHVYGFLDQNLVGVFAAAWSKFGELKRSAKETRKEGSTIDVSLATHNFVYEMEPHVDVLLNRVKVAEIPFKIELTCEVNGLDLFLKQGCIYQVRSGKCDCKAEIYCAEKLVWTRKLAGVNLPGALNLSKPIVLDSTPAEQK
jgi:hypothetical protein